MFDLITEGAIRQVEGARQEERRRRPIAIHVAADDAWVPEWIQQRRHQPAVRQRVLRWAGTALVSIGFWLEARSGLVTPT
jgi:hypothetical protein